MIYDGEVLIYKQGEMIQRNDRLSFHDVNLIAAEIDFENNKALEEPIGFDQREREFEFWEATTLGLFDYLRKSFSKGFVLSLSGGADSSACAVMVSEMVKKGIDELGIEVFLTKLNIDNLRLEELSGLNKEDQARTVTGKILITAYQGTKNSGNETLNSARELAQSIGATFYHWTVDEEINNYVETVESCLGRKLNWKQDDIALQNIQARSRAPVIWMLANLFNALLITTSNRSEGDVGYATMDGDTAGSIAPIAGVDKDFIRKWLIWAEKYLGQKGLSPVNSLTPTAELRPADQSQTDEKDLMPYSILVEIERLAIRDKKSPAMVFQELKNRHLEDETLLKAHVIKFFRLWTRNQWKRERIAPSFHLDEFNIDPRSWFRFPILSGGFKREITELEGIE
jgi:NAD+ synthase (glutamine-hydrolysing)